jgi:hypothetical protein
LFFFVNICNEIIQARQKAMGGGGASGGGGVEESGNNGLVLDGKVAVVAKDSTTVELPVSAIASVFEEKKPKRVLKKDWATSE